MCRAFFPLSGLIKPWACEQGCFTAGGRREKNGVHMRLGVLLRKGWGPIVSIVLSLAGCSESKVAEEKPTSDPARDGSTEAMEEDGAIPSVGRLEIEARGSGRAWHFSYCGPDGPPITGDERTSKGELRLPANTDVVIHLRSNDYIYVFSCPELNLKEIAVPDLEFSISFRTGGYGRYELAMDPMCGFPAAPGETMGTVHVVSSKEFTSWLGSCQ